MSINDAIWRINMKHFVVVILLLGAAALGILNYHFILFDKNIKLLKKTNMTIEYTFIDARGTGKAKLFLIPALLKAGIKDILREAG